MVGAEFRNPNGLPCTVSILVVDPIYLGRPSNTDARRAEIARALGRVMARVGYERASIVAIAREAGIAPGLVHYHFSSKSEVLVALVRELVSGARRRIDARLATADNPAAKLDAFIDALLARGEDVPASAVSCWALVGAEAVTQPEVRAQYAAFIGELARELAGLLARACQAEGRSGEGSKAMAGAMVATIEGYFALAAAAADVIPRGSASAMARHMARGLVLAQPARSK